MAFVSRSGLVCASDRLAQGASSPGGMARALALLAINPRDMAYVLKATLGAKLKISAGQSSI
jgi:hypothetical protein